MKGKLVHKFNKHFTADSLARGSLWTRIGQIMDIMYIGCCQAWALFSVVRKMTDSMSRKPILESQQGTKVEAIIRSFWRQLCKNVGDKLADVISGIIFCNSLHSN